MTPRSAGPADRAAVVSAALLVAAAPPSPLPLLVLGALVPLVLALARLPEGRRGRLAAFRAGSIQGAVAWAILLLWIPRAGLRVGFWVVPSWVAVVGTLALLHGVAAAGFHHLVRHRRVPIPLAAALAWGGMEWVRTAGLGPLSFPWLGLALPLAGLPVLIQGAAWVGEIGVALAVAAVNGAVAAALLVPPPARWRRLAGVAALTVAVAGWGRVRMAGVRTEVVASALLVQPSVPLAVKRGPPDEALAASLAAVEAALPPPAPPVAPAVGGDFVLLPETAVPAVLDGDGAAAVRRRVASWAARMGAPVVVGAWARGPGRGGNAVFVASDDPDAEWPAAWKVRLVPGVEWTPGFADAVAAGDRPTTLPIPGGPVLGPLVCIESAGPEPARTLVREGAQLLVNVTNDAWLAEGPWWTRTAAFHQHPAHLAFRAVELGVGVLRVGNNGRTEAVDPLGRRTLLLAPHSPGAVRAEASRLVRPTRFTSWGPWPGPVAIVTALLLGLIPARRSPPAVDPPPPL